MPVPRTKFHFLVTVEFFPPLLESLTFVSSCIITYHPLVDKMSSLFDVDVGQKSPVKFHSVTSRYREAFTMIKDQKYSFRQAARKCKVSRKRLKFQYELFLDSNVEISDFIYVKKIGRKKLLSPANQEILRIAAHTLDSVGHPLSRVTMNDVIRQLHKNENNGDEKLSKSSLLRYRREAKIPQRSVRNGISVRSKKTQVEYIDDFAEKYDEVVKQYSIRKELMYVSFHIYLFIFIYSFLQIQC
jgi:hypothetical protein